MRRRILTLTLALSAALGLAGTVRAHRLDAACRILPPRMVRVETWFDNGDIPKNGSVEVFSDSGELIIKGRLSSQGLFLFDAPQGDGVRVKIDAGQGHGKELAIRPEEVAAAKPAEPPPKGEKDQTAPPSDPAPPTHEQPFPIKDVLVGVGLVVAVAAFVMSVRNTRALRELRRPRV